MKPVRHRPAACRGLAVSAICAFTFTSVGARASESQLPGVLVTATRSPQSLATTLSDVRIIDAETIRDAGGSTLTELLRAHGGVEIAANGGPGQLSSVFIRGSNANHVVLLIDGVRINSATAGLNAWENIPLAQIERIEVVRGAASSLYGSDAIGGVIQIFTRSGARTEARIGVGSWRTREASVGVGRDFGVTKVSVQAGHNESDSFSTTHEGAGPFTFNPDADPYRNTNLGVTVEHEWASDHRLVARGLTSRGSTRTDNGPDALDANNQPIVVDEVTRQRLSSVALESRNRLAQDWLSLVRIARGTDDARSSGAFASRFRTDQDQATWQNDLNALGGQIAVGLDLRRERVNADTAFSRTRRDVKSAFGSYAAVLGAHSAQLSLRHDDDSQFGGHDTGNVAYGFQIAPQWRVSAGAGNAFKAPTFNDLYFPLTDFGAPGFPSLSGGNPQLRPERSRNVELAARFEDGAWRASVTAFRNLVSDLIATGPLPSDPSVSSVININRAKLRGATLTAGYTAADWRVNFEATHQQAVDTATGERLLRRARRHASASAAWTPGAWRIGADWVASGDREDLDFSAFPFQRVSLSGYALLNLSAGYTLTPELSVSMRLNNAADKRYELVRGFNTPPRNVFVALEFVAR